jgi:hypothetical protein
MLAAWMSCLLDAGDLADPKEERKGGAGERGLVKGVVKEDDWEQSKRQKEGGAAKAIGRRTGESRGRDVEKGGKMSQKRGKIRTIKKAG